MRRVLVAVAAGLALADSSVVALALPPILAELDTSVEGVAAVIGVYTLALALALLPAAALARRHGPGVVGAAGLLVFAAASLGCAVADSIGVLLAFRAMQAVGGAAALITAFDLLGAGDDASRGRRLWVAAAVFGTAAGPAVGGALTEAFDWRAIFVAQAPLAVAAAWAAWSLGGWRAVHDDRPASAQPWRPTVALALVSAALTAVLFLLVLELVAGWSVSPVRAALGVSVLPVAAVLAARIGGDALTRALTGCALVGAGIACLAFLPDARVAWTLAPQLLAGAGMGLALPALAGGLLPERDAADAARLLVARHAGIVAALLLLAPVVSGRLDDATEQARLRGTALVLDARLKPQDKLRLARDLLAGVEAQDPRAGLRRAIAEQTSDFDGLERAEFDRLAARADATLVAAVGDAFRAAFLITGALALLAAAPLVRRRALAPLGAGLAVAAAAVGSYAALDRARRPEPVAIADPCSERELPRTGGLTGFVQDEALKALDRAACRFGSSREELVLALADPDAADRFEDLHGVDPRSLGGLLEGILG